jgi:PncC family amidohydrolase
MTAMELHFAQAPAAGQPPSRDDLRALAEDTLGQTFVQDLTLVTAESCTAGLLAAALSEAPGASRNLLGGFVTYTKQQKTDVLRVPALLLSRRTAVCPEVARAMAQGALRNCPAHVALAVTGVAGPEPDEDGNPVGLVCLAAVRRGLPAIDRTCQFGPRPRAEILDLAVAEALALARDLLQRGRTRA